jgi:heat shock protein HtpX
MAPGEAPGIPTTRNLFVEQARNRRRTWLLLAGFVAVLGVLGLGFDVFVLGVGPGPAAGARWPVPVAAAAAATLGAVSAWLGYRFGDRAILAATGARPVSAADPSARVLINVVTEMALAAGLPMPRLYVVDDADPNAFATGRDPGHAAIAVTAGLLQVLTRDELQGVVAHEMAHVRNLDIRTMTVVAALLGAVLLLSDWAGRLRMHAPAPRRTGGDDGDRHGPSGPLAAVLFAAWLLAAALAPVAARVLAAAVSRQREYLADASGAELTRNPLGLASALRKLAAAVDPTRRIPRGSAHLCIADPLGRAINERTGRWADLLATHPPMAERIARLDAMAYRA